MNRTNYWALLPCYALLLTVSLVLGSLMLSNAANAQTLTLTFEELPTQPVDDLSFAGVTFDFKIAGFDSIDANYGSAGPGSLFYVDDPVLEGNSAGVLTLDFAVPTSILSFGVAELTGDPLLPGCVVDLYDSSLAPIGTIGVDMFPITTFSEGQFTYAGTPVGRAVITFDPTTFRFALDNLTYSTIPEPSAFALVVLACCAIPSYRRR